MAPREITQLFQGGSETVELIFAQGIVGQSFLLFIQQGANDVSCVPYVPWDKSASRDIEGGDALGTVRLARPECITLS